MRPKSDDPNELLTRILATDRWDLPKLLHDLSDEEIDTLLALAASLDHEDLVRDMQAFKSSRTRPATSTALSSDDDQQDEDSSAETADTPETSETSEASGDSFAFASGSAYNTDQHDDEIK
jgi:hypothetical protein